MAETWTPWLGRGPSTQRPDGSSSQSPDEQACQGDARDSQAGREGEEQKRDRRDRDQGKRGQGQREERQRDDAAADRPGRGLLGELGWCG
jgi:hypothetical protein